MRAIFLRGLICASVALVVTGCSKDAVVEDRSIRFGSSGSASFQHGADGVFINVDGETQRIFESEEGVLATSSPRWSPNKTQVLFTVARNVSGGAEPGAQQNWNDTPDGRVFGSNSAVQYDCYVYDVNADDSEPKKLFSSSVGHIGYIAADLVAKWLPDGSGIVFVSVNSSERHELKQMNLLSKAEVKAYPHAASWLIFDFVPGTSDLVVCTESRSENGVWIGSRATDWWHVSQARGPMRLQLASTNIMSMFNAIATSDSPLERLRGLMPVWSRDSKQFAFVTHSESGGTSKQPATHQYEVHVGSLQEKQVAQRHESAEPIYQVKWHPDSKSLGLVHSIDQKPALSSLPIAGGEPVPLTERASHRFAGWNDSGAERAMVAPVRELGPRDDWAFVVTHAYPGREALVVAGSTGEREVFSGTRITFPTWSDDGKSLSFWATFTPSHQTWMNLVGGGGVRNGDPAATVNIETGEIRWMPVSAIEKLQVGHYYLLKGDAKNHSRWYDEAKPELPEMESSNQQHLLAAHLYRAICYEQLGQNEKAEDSISKFNAVWQTELEKAARELGDQRTEVQKQQQTTSAVVSKHTLMLEAYLSVDAGELLESRLRKTAADDSTESDKLMHSVVLSQVFLLQDRHEDYANLVTETLLPQTFSMFNKPSIPVHQMTMERLLLFEAQLSLLPLFAPEYLGQLDSATASKLCGRIEQFRTESCTDSVAATLDAMLVRIYKANGNADAVSTTEDRLKQNSRVDTKSLPNAIKGLRAFPDLRSMEETE